MLSSIRPIEIIAEAGINSNGSLDIAKELIKGAKTAGADCVKFQLYDPLKRPDINEHPWKDILIESRITKRMLYEIKDYCDEVQIEFMASVFDTERVKWCEEIGMKRYKIASKSIHDEELIEAISNTGKPIIVSCGMAANGTDIRVGTFNNDTLDRLSVLYCISKYPTKLEDFIFYGDYYFYPTSSAVKESIFFTEFKGGYGKFNGFSDHSLGIGASIVAMSLGAKIIEKHITLDNSMPGPDHAFSLTLNELSLLCGLRNDIERILYNGLR